MEELLLYLLASFFSCHFNCVTFLYNAETMCILYTVYQIKYYNQNTFLAFCEKCCINPLLCTEWNLLRYIPFLTSSLYASCGSNLLPVRRLHLINGFNTKGFGSSRIRAAKASKAIPANWCGECRSPVIFVYFFFLAFSIHSLTVWFSSVPVTHLCEFCLWC